MPTLLRVDASSRLDDSFTLARTRRPLRGTLARGPSRWRGRRSGLGTGALSDKLIAEIMLVDMLLIDTPLLGFLGITDLQVFTLEGTSVDETAFVSSKHDAEQAIGQLWAVL
jgi:hypothetical protein